MLFALVLHVGNITFVTGEWPVRGDPESPPQPGARVANSDVLTRVAALLQATPAEVECAVCTKIIVVKEGDIEKPLEERLALQQRNSLAMHLYSLCFDWCVQLTNEAIGAPEGRTAVVGEKYDQPLPRSPFVDQRPEADNRHPSVAPPFDNEEHFVPSYATGKRTNAADPHS